MPFPMKIQPIDSQTAEDPIRFEPVKPVVKSRLKRLFECQFLRSFGADKGGVVEDPPHFNKDGVNSSTDFEPSSVCLAKMVQNFIEESNEKQSAAAVRCGRNRCNCFNRNCNDSSEDELDTYGGGLEACEILKSLVPCGSVSERNLLADTARIVEKNKICKRKDDFCRKVVTDGLFALGYDASICKSRWEKSSSYPAGEYDYIDVIIEGERFIIDIDFRSEFEIARSTKSYNSILQTLPYIFVGKTDRLQKILAIVSEAAKQSLKKKEMHIPPWRKVEYIKAKWLSAHTRTASTLSSQEADPISQKMQPLTRSSSQTSECELSVEDKSLVEDTDLGESLFVLSESSEEEEKPAMVKEGKPPEVKPMGSLIGVKVSTGLASVIEDEQ